MFSKGSLIKMPSNRLLTKYKLETILLFIVTNKLYAKLSSYTHHKSQLVLGLSRWNYLKDYLDISFTIFHLLSRLNKNISFDFYLLKGYHLEDNRLLVTRGQTWLSWKRHALAYN